MAHYSREVSKPRAVAPLSQQLVRRDASELVDHAMILASWAAELSELTAGDDRCGISSVL